MVYVIAQRLKVNCHFSCLSLSLRLETVYAKVKTGQTPNKAEKQFSKCLLPHCYWFYTGQGIVPLISYTINSPTIDRLNNR